MIGMLRGKLAWRSDPYIILDVSGVGYKVLAAQSVFSKVSTTEEIQIFTYTHVREDILELYGFASPDELQLFEQLISVSGVGPKSAIGVFSIGTRSEIVSAILTGDATFFTNVPRLGKKNAQKIIIELKNRVVGSGEEGIGSGQSLGGGESDDVIAALQGFGFTQREAYEAMRAVGTEGKDTGEKIRLALKYLGK